jgi:Protein of unknown function (DUF2971)
MFKFSKFDNYSTDNLRKNQIWCNYYEAFNDPFECWCIEKTGIPNPEEEKDRYDNIVSAWGYDPGPSNLDEYFEYCSEFDNKYSMRVSYYVESARLSCFCKRIDNLLMWAHYSDGLRGYCLEFDQDILMENNSRNVGIFNVVYQKKPPIVDTMLYEVAKDQIWYHEMAIDEEETKIKHLNGYVPDKILPEYHKALSEARKLLLDLYFKMLCYKPLDWQYEEEIRLIYHTESEEKSGEAFIYPPTALKAITIGEKASKENIMNLLAILKRNMIHIPVRIARRDKSDYKVIIETFQYESK